LRRVSEIPLLGWRGPVVEAQSRPHPRGVRRVGARCSTVSRVALEDRMEQWSMGASHRTPQRGAAARSSAVFSERRTSRLSAAAGHHEDAAREFRAAMHSPSLGFTRVNYELARCLLKLDRPQDAVAALQPALRGVVDASNLYITRTELHELLAQAFDRARMPD